MAACSVTSRRTVSVQGGLIGHTHERPSRVRVMCASKCPSGFVFQQTLHKLNLCNLDSPKTRSRHQRGVWSVTAWCFQGHLGLHAAHIYLTPCGGRCGKEPVSFPGLQRPPRPSSRSVRTLVRLFETLTRVCARDVTFAPGDRG